MAAARRTHFVDPAVNEQMARVGFAVLEQRATSDQVGALRELYARTRAEAGAGPPGIFLPSMTIADPALRSRLWDGVGRVGAELIAPLLDPSATEVLGGSFVAKPGSPHSVREPHQDPSVFDERRNVSISVWIPLSDTHRGNGTLYLLPGSHRMGNHVRPPEAESLDADVRAVARAESVPVELDAGQLLVIDGAVVHHSPPNDSTDERVAAIVALGPVGAEMVMVRSQAGAPSGMAEIYEVGVEMYRSGNLIEPDLSGARLLERVPYAPATLADLERSRA